MDSQNATPRRERRRTPRAEIAERWAALVVSLASLLLAIFAFWIAKRTDENTEDLAKSASTRYVGQFPGILPEIVSALQGAQKEIAILVDVPGYAIYSNHDKFLDYQAILHRKAQYVPIRIALLTPPRRMQTLQLQFGATNFENLKKEENYEIFRRWAGRNIVANIKNMTDFLHVLADAHNGLEAEFRHDMQVHEYDGDMTVYLWLVDDTIAVLSVPNLARTNPKETAFITHDPRLIGQLSNVFESYWSSSH